MIHSGDGIESGLKAREATSPGPMPSHRTRANEETNRPPTGDAERKEVVMANDVVRRDPFASSMEGFTPFRRMMDRFLDDPFFRPMIASTPFTALNDEGSLALDVYEHDGALKVEASLPGFKKDEVDVQVHDGILSIKAQRSAEHVEGEPGGKYYRRERSWDSVSRRVALPGIVKDAEVAAELKNGLLTLTIPLPETPQPKQIKIQGE